MKTIGNPTIDDRPVKYVVYLSTRDYVGDIRVFADDHSVLKRVLLQDYPHHFARVQRYDTEEQERILLEPAEDGLRISVHAYNVEKHLYDHSISGIRILSDDKEVLQEIKF